MRPNTNLAAVLNSLHRETHILRSPDPSSQLPEEGANWFMMSTNYAHETVTLLPYVLDTDKYTMDPAQYMYSQLRDWELLNKWTRRVQAQGRRPPLLLYATDIDSLQTGHDKYQTSRIKRHYFPGIGFTEGIDVLLSFASILADLSLSDIFCFDGDTEGIDVLLFFASLPEDALVFGIFRTLQLDVH